MRKILIAWVALLPILLTACNKPVLHGRDKDMEPVVRTFNAPSSDAYQAARETLHYLGYKTQKEDAAEGTIMTGWRATKADSHYVDLFDRRDYGTVGGYYRISIHVADNSGKSEVTISAPLRSIITNRMKSSHIEENKILDQIADRLRKEDVEITNVGIQE